MAAQDARMAAQDARIVELTDRVDRVLNTPVPPRSTSDTIVDAAGRVTQTLTEDAAIVCAKANLEGIATAQLAYDAAFDTYGDSFEQIGWLPSNQGDCAANVAFSMGPQAIRLVPDDRPPKVPIGVAVVVRGVARGRAFAVDEEARVHEVPRVAEARIPGMLRASEWVGGR